MISRTIKYLSCNLNQFNSKCRTVELFKMIKVLGIIFVVIVLFNSSWSYPSGAPESQCQAMTPVHGGFLPQQTKSSFELVPEAVVVFQGQLLKITIMPTSTSNEFKGFMIQARTQLNKIVGQFNVDKNELAVLRNCDSENSTATHSSRESKRMMVLEWEAPVDFEGKIHFQ